MSRWMCLNNMLLLKININVTPLNITHKLNTIIWSISKFCLAFIYFWLIVLCWRVVKNCQHCLNINISTSSINWPLYWIGGIDTRDVLSVLVMKRPSYTFSPARILTSEDLTYNQISSLSDILQHKYSYSVCMCAYILVYMKNKANLISMLWN